MNNKSLIMVLVLVALLGGGYMYMNMSQSKGPAMELTTPPTSDTQTQPSQEASMEGKMSPSDVKEIVVEGLDFKFAPATMNFKKGDHVKLVFKNTGKMPHDWVIDELGVRTKILKAGEQEVVEIVLDTTGTFEYYCSVGTHRAMGMKGTLTVQ